MIGEGASISLIHSCPPQNECPHSKIQETLKKDRKELQLKSVPTDQNTIINTSSKIFQVNNLIIINKKTSNCFLLIPIVFFFHSNYSDRHSTAFVKQDISGGKYRWPKGKLQLLSNEICLLTTADLPLKIKRQQKHSVIS